MSAYRAWLGRFQSYVNRLTLYERVAWGAIVVGVCLIMIGVFLF